MNESSGKSRSSMRSAYFKFGATLTAIWLVVGIPAMVYLAWRAWPLRPNELGDTLAGLFAPVAFLWLVLSFLHQADLVAVSREQVAAQLRQAEEQRRLREKARQPLFALAQTGGNSVPGGIRFTAELRNMGAAARDVEGMFRSGASFRFASMGHDEQHEVVFQLQTPLPSMISGLIDFVDLDGVKRTTVFEGRLRDGANQYDFDITPATGMFDY